MVPGLWLHHLLDAPVLHAPRYATILGSTCLGLTVLVLGWALRRGCPESRPSERALATLFPLAFVIPFYSVGHVGYPHALDAVVCAGIFGALASRRHPALCGLLIAAGVLVRLQNFLWLLWPLLEWTRAPAEDRRDQRLRLTTTAAVALLGVAPQVTMALAHPGSDTGPIRWSLSFFDLDNFIADLWTVLAGRHGLWSVTPLAALGCLGLVDAVRTGASAGPRGEPIAPTIALPAATVALAMVVLMATVRDPDGGHAYGARRLAGLTPILAFGLLHSLERATASGLKLRRFLVVLTLLAMGLNLIRTAATIAGALPLTP